MRVFLVDDHSLFRGGLESLLEKRADLEVVGMASSGAEALERVPELRPDIVLLDLKMPGMDGLETLRRLVDAGIEGRVVMLTVSDDEEDLVAALRSGASGYLLKDAEPAELNRSLDRVLAGETVIAPSLTGSLAQVVRGEDREEDVGPLDELTPREREILRHIALGESNKAIARALDISPDTVKLHVKNLLRKLGVGSRVSAAILATRHGLVEE
ncbi:two component transcriptional regulator, LuxR family [Thiohalorhabdus denitrificans]|uniref:Two component transcriptional regulator, LuxR family n=1 Tax=Thiohalorhabdus denitrificans TaxID=381306 RepID=A0A1G5F6Z6_9GAMM|nr:two component transcriptional regulator, LuxR family [Thiohalorhabdus denitrificans]